MDELLSTPRLILRYFRAGDAVDLHQVIFSDPQVMRHGDGIHSLQWTRTWIETCQHAYYEIRGYGPYAVVEQRTQNLIGYCGLFYFPNLNGQAEVEVGYRLACASWGKGYATEAALAVRDYAFSTLQRKRLIAMIDPSNIASIRVAEKLGMIYEQEVMLEGYTHPDHVYKIERG